MDPALTEPASVDPEAGVSSRRASGRRDRWLRGLLTVVLTLIRRGPVVLFPPLAWLLARLLFWVSSRDRRVIRLNLDRILGLSPRSPEGRRLATKVYENACLSTLETIRALAEPRRLKLHGLEDLHRLVARAEQGGRGLLIVTAHLGSWELVCRAVSVVSNRTFHVLGKPSEHPAVTEFLAELRAQAGTRPLFGGRRPPLRQMLGVLRDGDVLGVVVDQRPDSRRGPTVDFFGRPVEFVGGPGRLATRTRCAVVSCFCTRRGPFEYDVSATELVSAGSPVPEAVPFAQLMASEVERAIRNHVEQWSWSYKRWRFDD